MSTGAKLKGLSLGSYVLVRKLGEGYKETGIKRPVRLVSYVLEKPGMDLTSMFPRG